MSIISMECVNRKTKTKAHVEFWTEQSKGNTVGYRVVIDYAGNYSIKGVRDEKYFVVRPVDASNDAFAAWEVIEGGEEVRVCECHEVRYPSYMAAWLAEQACEYALAECDECEGTGRRSPPEAFVGGEDYGRTGHATSEYYDESNACPHCDDGAVRVKVAG